MKRFRKEALYTLSSYWISLVGLVRESILISMLTPAQLGLWRLLLTFQGYCKYISLNASDLCVYRGKPKGLVEKYYRDVISIITLLLMLIAPMFAFWASKYIQLGVSSGVKVLIIGLLSVFIVYTNVFCSLALSKKDFSSITLFQFTSPVILVLGLLIMGVSSGIELALTLVVANGLSLICYYKYFYSTYSYTITAFKYLKIKVRSYVVMLKMSANNLTASLSFAIFHTCEVWLIESKFGLSAVGFFSVVLVFTNIANLGSSALSTILFATHTNRIKCDGRFLIKVSLVSTVIVMLIALIGFYVLGYLINTLFVNYSPVLTILAIYSFCIPFLAIRNFGLTNIIANKNGTVFGFYTLILASVKITTLVLVEQSQTDFFITVVLFNITYGISSILFPFVIKVGNHGKINCSIAT